jgi:hypothetical protein
MSYPLVNGQNEVMALIEAEVSHGGVKVLLQRHPEKSGRFLNWVVTVGMVRYGLPEIIVFGMEPEVVTTVIKYMMSVAVNGEIPAHLGTLPEDYFSLTVFSDFVSGPLVEQYAVVIYDYYQLKGMGAPKITQWVVSDYEGRFPWNESFDPELRDYQIMLLDGHAS